MFEKHIEVFFLLKGAGEFQIVFRIIRRGQITTYSCMSYVNFLFNYLYNNDERCMAGKICIFKCEAQNNIINMKKTFSLIKKNSVIVFNLSIL